MKILITGSDGFIGKHLYKRLELSGKEVAGFDTKEGDIAEKGSLDRFLDTGIDYIFHLAGKTFIPESWTAPFDFYRTNFLGTLNVLDFCRTAGCGLTFISSYVYGKPDYLPIDENHPLKPYTPYTHSKILAENACIFYKETFHVPVCVIRPFNVFGPGQNGSFIIPEMIAKVLDPHSETITVKDLRPKRDYVFIGDMIEALLLTINGPRGIYNLGSGISYSISEIIQAVLGITGREKKIASEEMERPNEIFDLYADISRIRKDLNWEPRTSFHDGIAACIRSVI